MIARRILVLIGGPVLTASAAIITYTAWPDSRPDPATRSPEQITQYMASEEFGKLDTATKQRYFETLRQTSNRRRRRMPTTRLSDQERRRLRENLRPLFLKRMQERIDSYFDLPPEKRTEYLDEIIDRMRNRMDRSPTDRNRSRRRRGGWRNFTPDRMRQRIGRAPAEVRARRAAFRRALRNRMRQRGISRRR